MTSLFQTDTIEFANGNKARFLRTSASADVNDIISVLDLSHCKSILIINGRTSELDSQAENRLKDIFKHLAKFIHQESITVVTGGSNAGLFQLFGQAIGQAGGPEAPLVGVTVSGLAGIHRLEPHHTHFILVEGNEWGDETSIMYNLVSVLANFRPCLALFAGGGKITLLEMLQNVSQNREMILVEGIGGITEAIIDAKRDAKYLNPTAEKILKKGKITVFPTEQPAADLVNILHRILSPAAK